MNKYIAYKLSLMMFLCSCQKNVEYSIIPSEPIEMVKTTVLGDYYGSICSSTFINDSVLVVANKQGVISFYDLRGELLNEVSAVGTGPLEYVYPSIIRAVNNKVYVWDSQLLKMVVLNKDGLAIKEYTNFTRAITDFTIVENMLYIYLTGGDNEHLVQTMNPENGIILGSYIVSNPETNLLNMNQFAGGLATSGDVVFAAASSEINIQLIQNNKIERFASIPDNEFQVANLEQNATSFFNSNQQEAINYLMKNSYLKGIYSLENEIVVMCETGEYVRSETNFDSSNRYNIFYILNKNGDLIQKRKGSIDLTIDEHSIVANGQNIYLLKYDENLNEVEELILYKIL